MVLEDSLLWIEDHPGLAAWVQAVFSVVAIVAAILVANAQARYAREIEKGKLTMMRGLVKELSSRARRINFDDKSILNVKSTHSVIKGLVHSFDSISLLDLPDIELLEPVCSLRDSLRALDAQMDMALRHGNLDTVLTLNSLALWLALIKVTSEQIAALDLPA